MHNATDYDVLMIGGGQAGIPLAYKLAGRGRTVALAERKYLGGSCVNFGCSPTKAAIASAKVAFQARRAAEYGIDIPEVRVDFPAVLRRARGVAETKRAGLDKGLEDSENPVLIRGHARLEGREEGGFRVRVGDRSLLVGEVVLNTGTRTLIPPVDGLDAVDYIDAGNWMNREDLPSHLVLVGGSYIGLEMAQFYRRMGSEVTVVVGSSDHVTPGEDEDVAEAMRGLLAEEGIEFVFCERARGVVRDGDGLTLTLDGGDPAEIGASHLFLATGRRPNTDDLGLESVGVETDKRGFVRTDERLATDVEGIWAAGDIRGGPMFTHTSYDDHRVLLSQMAGDGSRTTNRTVPYAVFTDPELGRVGMTEREAREAGYEVGIHYLNMEEEKGKAFELGENKGFIKVVADASNDRVLGAAVLTAEGAELVHIYEDLMNADLPLSVVREAVYIHPTLAEDIQSAI
ncbi:MAG: PF00070 family, FAD-dependent NAD(P)-disulphide oxidoreductase [uncultured Rubrobacteraceae bacterium]|uniref:PF00070 family, FAD-dependent NAD(P)-disulphide oxidoreductase n=1 Tax=uncultured Rubrobacteraceae bacterium TaxID=349277 RepID=A0A6J4NNM5_9ACTN|nr:MAG: PF00070 family, FAD-dependent NAD(P)-disulphide oxidoreductase [uncultured Rubrobacteraceae bacterium]